MVDYPSLILYFIGYYAAIIGIFGVAPQLCSYTIYRLTKSVPVSLLVAPVVLVAIVVIFFPSQLYLGSESEPGGGGIRWSLFFSSICVNLFASGVILGPLRPLWRVHQSLPRMLRVQFLVPFSITVIISTARMFELPPGPLCDEGMVLFMEGGCDYGVTNIFFHSKLGLLLSLNLAFIVGWFKVCKTSVLGFIPHFVVAGGLATSTWSGGYCDSYYANPNGSIGQMVLEMTAFALLGTVVLQRWSGLRFRFLLYALIAWNLSYVGAFYLWLTLLNHWTWAHSIATVATLVAAAYAIRPRLSLSLTHAKLAR